MSLAIIVIAAYFVWLMGAYTVDIFELGPNQWWKQALLAWPVGAAIWTVVIAFGYGWWLLMGVTV